MDRQSTHKAPHIKSYDIEVHVSFEPFTNKSLDKRKVIVNASLDSTTVDLLRNLKFYQNL